MENLHNELTTLFVMRAASEPRFNELVDACMTGRAFNPVHLAACDFLPWEAIVNRLATVNYRTAAKLRRFVSMFGGKQQVDEAFRKLGANACLNGGKLSRAGINRTLCNEADVDALSSEIIRHKARLSISAFPSEKSDCLNLLRLFGWLQEGTIHQKRVDRIVLTVDAMAFFRSL